MLLQANQKEQKSTCSCAWTHFFVCIGISRNFSILSRNKYVSVPPKGGSKRSQLDQVIIWYGLLVLYWNPEPEPLSKRQRIWTWNTTTEYVIAKIWTLSPLQPENIHNHARLQPVQKLYQPACKKAYDIFMSYYRHLLQIKETCSRSLPPPHPTPTRVFFISVWREKPQG